MRNFFNEFLGSGVTDRKKRVIQIESRFKILLKCLLSFKLKDFLDKPVARNLILISKRLISANMNLQFNNI